MTVLLTALLVIGGLLGVLSLLIIIGANLERS